MLRKFFMVMAAVAFTANAALASTPQRKDLQVFNDIANTVNRYTQFTIFDDELRIRIARSIYGNPGFWNYAVMANPPILIIVEHSRVTLSGVVASDVDRALARSLATEFGALSVTNNLKTDAEVGEALEKSF